jgi:2-dehydropantoate 2-reductase
MRIAVVGLGGVGGYLAASLVKTSHELVGFARGKHLRAIGKHGIKIIEDDSVWTQRLNAMELNAVDGYFDIVLFCVKSYDLPSSYNSIKNSCDSKTIMLSFANGVSNGDVLRVLSDSVVLDGCVYILSHIQEAGVVRKKGKVFAAVFGGDTNATEILNSIFTDAGLRTKTPEDIKTAIWKKYIFISAFATLTSYYDNSIGYVYEQHKEEARSLLEEISLVANAIGIDVNAEIEKSLETAFKVPYDSSTSMYLDFKNSKRDELDSLSGYIVKKAQEFSLEVPLMKKMYEKLLKKHID